MRASSEPSWCPVRPARLHVGECRRGRSAVLPGAHAVQQTLAAGRHGAHAGVRHAFDGQLVRT